MLANPVSAQFKKAGPVTGHVVAIEVLHENVQKLYEDALAISKTINDIGVKKLQALETAKAQLKLAEEGLKLAGKGLEESENLLKKRDELIAAAEKTLLDAAKIIDENPGLITGWQQQMEAAKIALDAQESGLEGLRDAVRVASKAREEAQKVLDAINKSICKWLPWPLDKLACDSNPAYATAEATLNAAKELLAAKKVLNEALNAITGLKKLREDLGSKIAEAERAIADAGIVQRTVRAQLDVHRAQRKLEAEGAKAARKGVEEATKVAQQAQQLVDKVSKDLAPVVDLLARYNPIVLFLQHWAADIRRASGAFSKSSQGVAEHLLAKMDGNALRPYLKWYECWSPGTRSRAERSVADRLHRQGHLHGPARQADEGDQQSRGQPGFARLADCSERQGAAGVREEGQEAPGEGGQEGRRSRGRRSRGVPVQPTTRQPDRTHHQQRPGHRREAEQHLCDRRQQVASWRSQTLPPGCGSTPGSAQMVTWSRRTGFRRSTTPSCYRSWRYWTPIP